MGIIKIPNTKYQIPNNTGFSLIELLVTMLIIGLIGTAASATLVALLRGANKTEVIKEVKQNGDYALSVMETKIRNSTINDVDCIGTTNSLTINNPDSSITVFNCSSNRISDTTGGVVTYLTNTSVTMVDCTADLSFGCSGIGSNKTVSIKFTLQQAATTTAVSDISSATFQTQVTLRNK